MKACATHRPEAPGPDIGSVAREETKGKKKKRALEHSTASPASLTILAITTVAGRLESRFPKLPPPQRWSVCHRRVLLFCLFVLSLCVCVCACVRPPYEMRQSTYNRPFGRTSKRPTFDSAPVNTSRCADIKAWSHVEPQRQHRLSVCPNPPSRFVDTR